LIQDTTSERQPGSEHSVPKFFRLEGNASLAFILIVTTLVFLPSLFNDFTNWDDEIYIVNNSLITHLSPGTVANIFTTPQYMGNYHPVTLLSYALDYAVGESHPFVYHLDNLLLHLACAVFLFLLLREFKLPPTVPFIVCLLFGIHPLHVEPVAWLSARKDVLYGAFFLCSLFCYAKYAKNNARGLWYVLSLLFFTCSVLSKAVAVVTPVVLLLLDWIIERTPQRRMIWEKIPFVLISVIFGVVAIAAQQATKSITENPAYGVFDRLCIGAYGLWSYLGKILLPEHLSAFYFYPSTDHAGLPLPFQLAFFGMIALVGLTAYSFWKSRIYSFGSAFFILTLALVLQVFPVGRALMADRYAYIPSIGIFLIIGMIFSRATSGLRQISSSFALTLQIAAWLYCLWLALTTMERCEVWNNGITVWSDVLTSNPGDPGLYNSRGQAYLAAGEPQLALRDFEKAISLKPDYKHALTDRGLAHFALQQLDSAVIDFSEAIGTDSTFSLAFYDRANTYARQMKYPLAINDYATAIRLKPDYGEAYYNRAVLKLAVGDSAGACADYRAAVKFLAKPPQAPIQAFCR